MADMRVIELVQGAAGLPMVSGELMALRACGLIPPPGGKLTGQRWLQRGGYLRRPPERARAVAIAVRIMVLQCGGQQSGQRSRLASGRARRVARASRVAG